MLPYNTNDFNIPYVCKEVYCVIKYYLINLFIVCKFVKISYRAGNNTRTPHIHRVHPRTYI